jgi:hypothetical protein
MVLFGRNLLLEYHILEFWLRKLEPDGCVGPEKSRLPTCDPRGGA